MCLKEAIKHFQAQKEERICDIWGIEDYRRLNSWANVPINNWLWSFFQLKFINWVYTIEFVSPIITFECKAFLIKTT